jgi:anti-sigma factor RsiW
MTCDEARPRLDDARRRRLAAPERARLEEHLAGCPDCTRHQRSEQALDEALARLPRHPAPPALRARLAALAAGVEEPAPPARRRAAPFLPALAAALVVAIGAGALWALRDLRSGDAVAVLGREAVVDHLRLLASAHPLDVEAGGAHQVKPWFEGRLDFAPTVPSADGTGLVLQGGAVGYFLDRKAAVIAYRLRLHQVTLLVFPAEGLEGLGSAATAGAPPSPRPASLRGFHAYLWRSGGLGYALVSDVDPAELAGIARRLAAETAPAR